MRSVTSQVMLLSQSTITAQMKIRLAMIGNDPVLEGCAEPDGAVRILGSARALPPPSAFSTGFAGKRPTRSFYLLHADKAT